MKKGIALLVVLTTFAHLLCACAPATVMTAPTLVPGSTPIPISEPGQKMIVGGGEMPKLEEMEAPTGLPQTIPGQFLTEPFGLFLGVMSRLDKHFEEAELGILPVSSPLVPGQNGNLPNLPRARLLVWESSDLGQKGAKPFYYALGGESYQVFEVSGNTALLDIKGTWKKEGWWVQWEVGGVPSTGPKPYASEMKPTNRLFLAKEIGGQEKLWIEGKIRSPDSYFDETVFLPVDFLLERGISLEISYIQEIVRVHAPLEGWDKNDTYRVIAIGAAILVGGALLIYGGQVVGVLPQGLGVEFLAGMGEGIWTATKWVAVRGARVGFVLLKGVAYAVTLTVFAIGAALLKVVPVVWTVGKDVATVLGEEVIGPLLKATFELGFKLIEVVVSGSGSLIRWIIRIIPFIGFRFEAVPPRRFALA